MDSSSSSWQSHFQNKLAAIRSQIRAKYIQNYKKTVKSHQQNHDSSHSTSSSLSVDGEQLSCQIAHLAHRMRSPQVDRQLGWDICALLFKYQGNHQNSMMLLSLVVQSLGTLLEWADIKDKIYLSYFLDLKLSASNSTVESIESAELCVRYLAQLFGRYEDNISTNENWAITIFEERILHNLMHLYQNTEEMNDMLGTGALELLCQYLAIITSEIKGSVCLGPQAADICSLITIPSMVTFTLQVLYETCRYKSQQQKTHVIALIGRLLEQIYNTIDNMSNQQFQSVQPHTTTHNKTLLFLACQSLVPSLDVLVDQQTGYQHPAVSASVASCLTVISSLIERAHYNKQDVQDTVLECQLSIWMLVGIFGDFNEQQQCQAVNVIWQLWHKYSLVIDTEDNLNLHYEFSPHTEAAKIYRHLFSK